MSPPRSAEGTLSGRRVLRRGANLHPYPNSSNLDAHLAQFLDELRGHLAQFGGDGRIIRRQYQRLPVELPDMAGTQQGRRNSAPVMLLQRG